MRILPKVKKMVSRMIVTKVKIVLGVKVPQVKLVHCSYVCIESPADLNVGSVFLERLCVLVPVVLVLSEHLVDLVLRLVDTTHVRLPE